MTDGQDALARLVLDRVDVREGLLVPAHGWTNWAWIGATTVVRVSSGRLVGSFAHEAAVARLLADHGLPVAGVVGHGEVGDLHGHEGELGEWLVTRRLPGRTLADAWPELDSHARRAVGEHLGRVLEALHQVRAGDLAPTWWRRAIDGEHHNAYHPPVGQGAALVSTARLLPDADQALLDAVGALLEERLVLFADDEQVLVHCDAHGHNVLVDGMTGDAYVSGLLDLEGAHMGPPDMELDMFLRWATAAHDFPSAPGKPCRITLGDALELIGHVAHGYPSLFSSARLLDRLEVYEIHWQLVQLHFDAWWVRNHPDRAAGRGTHWQGLADALDGRSHLAALARAGLV